MDSIFDNNDDLNIPEGFSDWRKRLNKIIFGYQTFLGKLFDLIVLAAILLSMAVIMLESVGDIHEEYGHTLIWLEWAFTLLFSLEYIARIISHPRPIKYILSFMGIIDLLSVIPTYLGLVFTSPQSSLLILRAIRLVRIFRILKLTRYIGGANTMYKALWNSRFKITVFLGYILCIVVIVGTLLYVIEGGKNGFTSIPRSIYWAIVTLTTVGYGDIAPQTVMGQTLASIVMIMGYAIIAVPTGIVTGEMIRSQRQESGKICQKCKSVTPLEEANYCFKCGEPII